VLRKEEGEKKHKKREILKEETCVHSKPLRGGEGDKRNNGAAEKKQIGIPKGRPEDVIFESDPTIGSISGRKGKGEGGAYQTWGMGKKTLNGKTRYKSHEKGGWGFFGANDRGNGRASFVDHHRTQIPKSPMEGG